MKWNWKNPHCEIVRRSTHEGWRRESTGRAGCDTARCQTRCTASLGTWACCSDRVWCDTCGNASAPPCSTCLRTPACGWWYILVVGTDSQTAGLLSGGHSHLGLLHSLSADCTPVPQVLEQWDHVLHWPQPPFTVSGSLPTITHSPEIHHWDRKDRIPSTRYTYQEQ